MIYRQAPSNPALSQSDMVNAVPEIREVANVEARVLFSIFSENMNVEHWQRLAEAVAKEINDGADAIIIPHGTDTMGYTAAALSFMLPEVSRPVVLVGAQRSSDRPSSDASSNLLAAARFCTKGNTAGIFVIMHDTPGDDSFLSTSVKGKEDAHIEARPFHSINAAPLAHIDAEGKISSPAGPSVHRRKGRGEGIRWRRTRYYSNSTQEWIPALFEGPIMKSKGIVIAGSGLGHVNENMVPLIKKACATVGGRDNIAMSQRETNLTCTTQEGT